MFLRFLIGFSIGLNALSGALCFYITIKTGNTFYISLGAVNLGLVILVLDIARKDFNL